MDRKEVSRLKLAIHQELMERATIGIMRIQNGEHFSMAISKGMSITMSKKEIFDWSKPVNSLGLGFGYMVKISNDFYSKTYAVYLGDWQDPNTPNKIQ